MNITVNGDPAELPDGASLADAVTAVTSAPTGVAVSVNDDVVPRGQWAATGLNPGDRIEILTAVQGG